MDRKEPIESDEIWLQFLAESEFTEDEKKWEMKQQIKSSITIFLLK